MVYGKTNLRDLKAPRVIFNMLPKLFLKYFPRIISENQKEASHSSNHFHLGFVKAHEETIREIDIGEGQTQMVEYHDCFLLRPLRERNLDKNLMAIDDDYTHSDDINIHLRNLIDVIHRLGEIPRSSEMKKVVNLSALMDMERESLLRNLASICQLRLKITLIQYSKQMTWMGIEGIRISPLAAHTREFFRRVIENKRSPLLSTMMASPGLIAQIMDLFRLIESSKMTQVRLNNRKVNSKFQGATKKLIQGEQPERTGLIKEKIKNGLFHHQMASEESATGALLSLYKEISPDMAEPKSSPVKTLIQLNKKLGKPASFAEEDVIPGGGRDSHEAFEFYATIYEKAMKDVLYKEDHGELQEDKQREKVEVAKVIENIVQELDLKSLSRILASLIPKKADQTFNNLSSLSPGLPFVIDEVDTIIELMQESTDRNSRIRGNIRRNNRETSVFGVMEARESEESGQESESMELNLNMSRDEVGSVAKIGQFDLQKYYLRTGMDNLDLHEIEEMKRELRQTKSTSQVDRFTYMLCLFFTVGGVIKLALLFVMNSIVDQLSIEESVLLDLNGIATPVSFFFKESTWLLLNQTEEVPWTGLSLWNFTEDTLKSRYKQIYLKRQYIPDRLVWQDSKLRLTRHQD